MSREFDIAMYEKFGKLDLDRHVRSFSDARLVMGYIKNNFTNEYNLIVEDWQNENELDINTYCEDRLSYSSFDGVFEIKANALLVKILKETLETCFVNTKDYAIVAAMEPEGDIDLAKRERQNELDDQMVESCRKQSI